LVYEAWSKKSVPGTFSYQPVYLNDLSALGRGCRLLSCLEIDSPAVISSAIPHARQQGQACQSRRFASQSFVREISTNPNDAVIVETIISMA